MKFSLVGIGGVDVLDGNKKLILAIVWQLMHRHTMNVLTAIGGGKKADDATIVAWANATVARAGKEDSTMRSFKDKTLANGLFLMDLLSSAAVQEVARAAVVAARASWRGARRKSATPLLVLAAAAAAATTITTTVPNLCVSHGTRATCLIQYCNTEL